MGRERLVLIFILLGGLGLNLWGNEWGLPARWHPDEHFISDAMEIVWNRDGKGFLDASLYIKTLASGQFLLHSWAMQNGHVPAAYEDILELARYSVRPGHAADIPYVVHSIRLGRSLSAVFAAIGVLATYQLGRRLASANAGLLAAVLLTVSMGFMNLAHFATYDMFTIAFVSTTAVWAVEIGQNGRTRSYLLAACFAALAASGKPIGYLAILMVLAAHLVWVMDGRFTNWPRVWQRRSLQKIGAALLFFVLSFLFFNPVWLIEPAESIAFLQAVFAYVFRGIDQANQAAVAYAPRSNWVVGFFNLVETLGWPLLVTMAAGLVWALAQVWRRSQPIFLVLLAWVIPYSLLMGFSSLPMIAARHMVPLFPFLAVFSALMLLKLRQQSAKTWRRILLFCGLVVIFYSLAFTTAAAQMFRLDSRYAAAAWLAENLAAEGSILVSGSPTVRAYFPTIPFEAAGRLLPSQNEADWQVVSDQSPRYIVMSSIYYGRYYAWPAAFPQATQFHNELFEESLGYRLVARFPPDKPALPPENAQTLMDYFTPPRAGWLAPKPEFVDPTILIFELQ